MGHHVTAAAPWTAAAAEESSTDVRTARLRNSNPREVARAAWRGSAAARYTRVMKSVVLRSVRLVMVGLAPVALVGCGGGVKEHADPVPVTAADFTAGPDEPAELPQERNQTSRVLATTEVDQGVKDVVVVTGAPLVPANTATTSAKTPIFRELQVDQLVGQINGRPVYADEFFEPMDERLTREAERLNQRDFIAFARKEIEASLWDTLRDELLLSEFQGSLTNEQRLGVLAFIEEVRRDIVSGNLGSEALASQRLREAEGLDFPPYPGELGRRIFENVSREAWKQWLEHQKMLVNENRLNLADKKARDYLAQQMERHFFGGDHALAKRRRPGHRLWRGR